MTSPRIKALQGKAYHEGRQAYHDGVTDCPYAWHGQNRRYQLWQRGRSDARNEALRPIINQMHAATVAAFTKAQQ